MKQPFSIAILGVPIENLTLEEAISQCVDIIEASEKSNSTHYLSTINVDFLVQAHSWNFTTVRFPELLKVYRESALALADGMPILWLSKLLGSPIQSRVTGKDLLPKLAQALGKTKKSIYLLGGLEKTAKAAAILLQDQSPGLHIAGVSTPYVYFEGIEMINEGEHDSLLVKQINDTKPSLLAINLGNPKQEVWFERVRQHLQVPLSLGIGGTFSAISGDIARPPKWIQNIGMEWLVRLFQEPRRLWKRYLIDIIKFTYMSVPLVIYHTISRFLFHLSHSEKDLSKVHIKTLLFQSSIKSLVVIRLPLSLDKNEVVELSRQIEEAQFCSIMILDFNHVCHIQPEGFALLIDLWLNRQQNKKEIYALKISNNIKRLMCLHRIWDLIKEQACFSSEDLISRLMQPGATSFLYDVVYQNDQNVTISFFGVLNHTQDYTRYLEKLAPILCRKNCLIDLSYCAYLDNSGLLFLLHLRECVLNKGNSLNIIGLSEPVRRRMKLANVLIFFEHT